MSDTNEREEFERGIKSINFPLTRKGCGYRSTYTDNMWIAYQAGRRDERARGELEAKKLEASDARYQARVRDLEEALHKYGRHSPSCDALANESGLVGNKCDCGLQKALSTTTPDTALQKALLEREISALQQFEHYHTSIHNQIVELRAQLAALGECSHA